jgi:hypothetical protein
MREQEPFFKRWSRLKVEQKEQVKPPSSKIASKSQDVAISPSEEKELEEKPVAELPPVESLTKDSDFTAFLRKGVPEALRQQALHKLWASDPAFAAPDPLDFQNVDYTKLVTGEVVTSSYEVGKGFADRLDELTKDEAATKAPVEPAAAVQTEPKAADDSTAKDGGDVPPSRT